jgi:DNA replication and repair protein RecF
MLWLEYIDVLRSYRRVLKHRNMALKSGTMRILDTLDEQLAKYGFELMAFRHTLESIFQEKFSEDYERVSRLGTKLAIQYAPSWSADSSPDEIVTALGARRAKDLEATTTLSGPHRDRWVFIQEKRDFSSFASTGQLRLASLILRIVQVELYAELRNSKAPRYPILLLDDVLLELDVAKRRRFFSLLPSNTSGAQAVFTFLPEEPWREYADEHTIVYRVSNGRFSSEKSF